jgi:hypothetical protein
MEAIEWSTYQSMELAPGLLKNFTGREMQDKYKEEGVVNSS